MQAGLATSAYGMSCLESFLFALDLCTLSLFFGAWPHTSGACIACLRFDQAGAFAACTGLYPHGLQFVAAVTCLTGPKPAGLWHDSPRIFAACGGFCPSWPDSSAAWLRSTGARRTDSGMTRLGVSLLMLDFASMGLMFLMRSMFRTGPTMPVYGMTRSELILPAVDFLHLGFSPLPQMHCRLGLILPAYGMTQLETPPSVPDHVSIDLPMFLRHFVQLGSLALTYGLACVELTASALDLMHFEPSLPTRGLQRTGGSNACIWNVPSRQHVISA